MAEDEILEATAREVVFEIPMTSMKKPISIVHAVLIFGALGISRLSGAAIAAGDQPTLEPCQSLTILVAKKIYTMDPGRPTATSVALCEGRIVGVGDTLQDLEPWTTQASAAAHVTIDTQFADKILFPGFIDAHQHPLLGAFTANLPMIASLDTAQAYGPDIAGVKSEREAFERLRRYDREITQPSSALLVWGWDVPIMGRHLTREDLDRVSTTRPILVWDASQHHAYVNSAFLTQRKIPKDIAISGVGRDTAGDLNGQFLGIAAATYVIRPLVAERLKPEDAIRLMRWLIALNHRHGITTTTDHDLGFLDLELERALLETVFNHDNTPQRLLAITDSRALIARNGSVEAALTALENLKARSTDRLIFNGVKFFTDDSFNGLTFKPGAGGFLDGRDGLWVTRPEDLLPSIEPWWRSGQQIFVHSIGIEAQDATLTTLKSLQTLFPRVDHRFTIEHFGMARYDHIRAMKSLGVSANVNIHYVWLRGEAYANIIGKDRAGSLSPLGTLVKAGVPTTIHSDFPVAPPKPLTAVSLAVTRLGPSGKVLGAGQAVSVHDALKMITIDAAHVLGIDDRLGSIEPGKLADFVILHADPYATEPSDIKDIAVAGTILGGRVFPKTSAKPPE